MNTIGTWTTLQQGSSSRSESRTRWPAATATSTARRSSTPAACLRMACPFVYAYEAWGHTYVGCMQKIYDVEIDLDLLEAGRVGRGGFGARPRDARAASDVRGRGRRDVPAPRGRARLPHPGVPRASARARDLPRLRDRRRLGARRSRRSVASSGLARGDERRAARSMSAVLRPPSGHVSSTAGRPRKAGCPRNVGEPVADRRRRRRTSCRSRFEPSGVFASFTCSSAQPVEPEAHVEIVERLVERRRARDVDTGCPPVTRVEADAEPLVPVERVAMSGELVDRAADRAAGPRRVLQTEPEIVRRQRREARARAGRRS